MPWRCLSAEREEEEEIIGVMKKPKNKNRHKALTTWAESQDDSEDELYSADDKASADSNASEVSNMALVEKPVYCPIDYFEGSRNNWKGRQKHLQRTGQLQEVEVTSVDPNSGKRERKKMWLPMKSIMREHENKIAMRDALRREKMQGGQKIEEDDDYDSEKGSKWSAADSEKGSKDSLMSMPSKNEEMFQDYEAFLYKQEKKAREQEKKPWRGPKALYHDFMHAIARMNGDAAEKSAKHAKNMLDEDMGPVDFDKVSKQTANHAAIAHDFDEDSKIGV